MKRITLLHVVCATLLSTAVSAAMAQAGIKMTIPAPVGTKLTVASKPLVVRHPVEAGIVNKVISGTFVPGASSWIAQGDKATSLCYLNKLTSVTCTPIVPAATMQGMDVSFLQTKLGGVLYVRPLPGSKQSADANNKTFLRFVHNYQVATKTLNQHAIRHAGDLPRPSVIAAGGGGGCENDDDGGTVCTGQPNSGGEGSGGSGGLPTAGGTGGYPTGGWNNSDPGPDPNGSGEPGRSPNDEGPTPANNAAEPCVITPIGVVCTMTGTPPPPPPWEVPPAEDIPPLTLPPSQQTDWCHLIGINCPGDAPAIGQYGDAAWRDEGIRWCKIEAVAKYTFCLVMKLTQTPQWYMACMKQADKSYGECLKAYNDGYNDEQNRGGGRSPQP